MTNRETGNKTLFKITLPSIPKGEEGVKKALEIHNEAVGQDPEYPIIEPHLDRLITKPDQIKWVSQADLEQMHEERLRDRIGFRMLLLAGAPPKGLRSSYLEKQNVFFGYGQPNPTLYMANSYFGQLVSDNPIDRVLAAVNIATNVLETNFNLLPIAQDLPKELRKPSIHLMRLSLDGQLEKAALDVGDEIEDYKFEATQTTVYSLLYSRKRTYKPRLVCLGGQALLVLPHQTTESAEQGFAQEDHKNVYYYFAEPIVQRICDRIRVIGYTQGTTIPIPKDFQERSNKGKQKLDSLELDRKSGLKDFTTSNLALKIIQSSSTP